MKVVAAFCETEAEGCVQTRPTTLARRIVVVSGRDRLARFDVGTLSGCVTSMFPPVCATNPSDLRFFRMLGQSWCCYDQQSDPKVAQGPARRVAVKMNHPICKLHEQALRSERWIRRRGSIVR